jgi:ABC-type sugar transport system permease subunit
MLVFLMPALVLFTTFVAIPSVVALGYSLHKWDGLSEPEFIGFGNFVDLFQESDLFVSALGHNVFIMFASGIATLSLSLFFASLIHRRIRGAQFFRVTFFFPNVISSVAIALLWVLLYSTTDFGVFNGFLHLVNDGLIATGKVFDQEWHLPFAVPFPFIESRYLIYSIVPMLVWTATGFYMVLFLAAMENIPETYYEAAKLDGASEFAQFRHVTLPLIREVLTVGLVFLVIGGLKLFDAIWVMENAWPRKESHVMATLLYQKAFSEYNVGYGSAVAVVMFALVFAATLVTLRMSRREALEY